MPRRYSGIYTTQELDTCYAHASSKLFSRIIKVIFTSFFKVEAERCDWLYNPHGDTHLIEHYKNEDTWENCKDEILSNLLFLFFYKKSIEIVESIDVDGHKRNGYIGSYIHYVLNGLKNFISRIIYRDPISVSQGIVDTITSIMYMNSLDLEKRHFLSECIKTLSNIFIVMSKLIKDGNLKLNFKYINLDLLEYFDDFLNCLDRGFYAILDTGEGHAITIIGYVRNGSSIDLITKNSWGKEHRRYIVDGEDYVDSSGIIRDFKLDEKIGIYFIEPIMNLPDSEFIEFSKERVEEMATNEVEIVPKLVRPSNGIIQTIRNFFKGGKRKRKTRRKRKSKVVF
jgi:hypothetical protein